MAATASARLDIGKVVNRTFSAIGGNLVTFLVLSALLAGIPAIVGNWLVAEFQRSLYSSSDHAYGGVGFVWQVGGSSILLDLISLVAGYVLTGAITYGSIVFYNGRKASIGECLSTGVRFSLPLVGVAIVTSIGIFFGLILVIIPGIMMAVRWSVAAPAVVMEGSGVMGSIERSSKLTSGSRWRIFLLLLIYVVLSYLIQFVVLLPAGVAAAATAAISANDDYTSSLSYFALIAVGAIVTAVLTGAGLSALYFELRTMKDGVSTNDLAKVFE